MDDDGAPVRRRASPSSSSTSPPRSAGIGANRANPGRYWYANLMMGAHVLEQSRLHEVGKLVIAGTVCAYPKFTPVPFQRGRPLERLPGGDERALRRREEGAPRRRARPTASSTAERDLSSCRRTSTGRATTSTSRRSHVIPALIRKMVEPRATRSCSGATARRRREFLYVDDCVEGLVLAAERYDGAEPVNLGAGVEISIRELAELDRRRDRLRGRDRLGHVDAERPAAAQRSTRRARPSCSASRRARRSAKGSSARSPGTAAASAGACGRLTRRARRARDRPPLLARSGSRRRTWLVVGGGRAHARRAQRLALYQGGDQTHYYSTTLAARRTACCRRLRSATAGRLLAPLAAARGAERPRRAAALVLVNSSSCCRSRCSASTAIATTAAAAGCSATRRRALGRWRRRSASRSSSSATTRSYVEHVCRSRSG